MQGDRLHLMRQVNYGGRAIMAKTVGELIAADLPVRDDDSESDLISLVDIVITGIETGWVHFWVSSYEPESDGIKEHWAYLYDLEDRDLVGAPKYPNTPVILTAEVVRKAVAAYMDSRIDGGMSLHEAKRLVDGSYTDAVIADTILQFAVYGKEVYG